MIFRRKINSGFTLVELLVTISIFSILTGVVLFGQSKFNSSILLTNLAYDTALTIRQAQNYGINIKEFNDGADGRFLPYGVHFDISDTGDRKSFILFADTTYVNDSDTGSGVFGGSSDACDTEKGCVNRYSIKRGNIISKLCVNDEACNEDSEGVGILDIVFQRPNPDAIITVGEKSDYANATIVLRGVDGSERRVYIQQNGLIQIKTNQ